MMGETLLYFTFGMCAVCCASVLICVKTFDEWKHSEQRAHEEYWKLKIYLQKLDIEKDSERHIINEIKSIKELVAANKRLQKATMNM